MISLLEVLLCALVAINLIPEVGARVVILNIPYYRCNSKICVNTQKSIKKQTLEGLFSQVLQMAAPSKQIVNLTKAITLEVYNRKITAN